MFLCFGLDMQSVVMCDAELLTTTSFCDLSVLQMRAHPFQPSRTRSSALSSGGCLNSNSGESPAPGLGTCHFSPQKLQMICFQMTYVVR